MINSYEFGKILINGKTYTSDVIIFSNRIKNWWRKNGHEVCIDDIKDIIDKKPDVLIIGTGHSGIVKILPEVKSRLREEKIELIEKPTREACEIFNKMSNKNVIAALHLTC